MPVTLYEAPCLPDFLFDHTLLGDDEPSRLREHLSRWCQLVGSLWINPQQGDVGYGLGFLSDPAESKIHLLVAAASEQAALHAEACERLKLGLASFQFQLVELPSKGLDFAPIHDNVLEVRQWEGTMEAAGRRMVQQELYAVGGWWGPGGVFAAPVATLNARHHPVLVYTLLKPTSLSYDENAALARHAMDLETAASRQISATSGQLSTSKERFDPQASAAAGAMAWHLRRLDHPFLIQTFVLSSDRDSAQAVAGAIASQIQSEAAFRRGLERENESIETRAMVIPLAEPNDILRAAHALINHTPDPAIARHPQRPESLARLPHLIDARGAATCFRFPVSVKSGFTGIEVRQMAPDFQPGPGVLASVQGSPSVALGTLSSGCQVHLPLTTITRHMLITGFTGSGKTETTLNVLHQLWNDHGIPFLVIEPAKQEYRGLATVRGWRVPPDGGPGLAVFTAGDETASPLRFNPLQPLPGVRIETHLGRVLTCLEAALPQFGTLPSILLEALERSYAAFGWKDLTVTVEPGGMRAFPTITHLVEHSLAVIEDRRYSSEIRDNLQGAIRSRLYPLQAGSLGRMLNTHCPVEAEWLYQRPVVVEMNDLRSQDKILLTLLLLVHVREFRETAGLSPQLRHVTVIEEAHNVFPRTEDRTGLDTGNAKFQAVQELSNMLAEMRAYGEGIIIADQSPNKLAPDAMRNTATQISHQLRDADDRHAMANTMVMSSEQAEFLAKLLPGRAALFTLGLQRATFMEVPRYKPSCKADQTAKGHGYSHGYDLRAGERHPTLGRSSIQARDHAGELLGAVTQALESGQPALLPRTVLVGLGLSAALASFEESVTQLAALPTGPTGDEQAADLLAQLVANSRDAASVLFPSTEVPARLLALALCQSLWSATTIGPESCPSAESLGRWFV